MIMRVGCALIIFLLSLSLAGCGGSQVETQQSSDSLPSNPQFGASADSTGKPLQIDNAPDMTEMPSEFPPAEKFVSLAKQDLASRLGVDNGKVTLVKVEEKLWLNAALGCPRPGQFYTQGRVPGFQIWLEVEGTEYIYNTDFTGTVILCPELNPHVPNSTSDPTPGVPIR